VTTGFSVWIVAPAICLSFAAYGRWIATVKRTGPVQGLPFGLLLGPTLRAQGTDRGHE